MNKLINWFEIDEKEYMWYILQGYEISVDDQEIAWYLNGKYHRTDGPAIEYRNGSHYWFLNGKLHRTDGPAIEHRDGTCSWYLNGVNYTERVL